MGVDRFYSFWFEFSSWREYSYLDEEERQKEAKEAEEKQKANALKQEKEAQKKALKAERKKLRNISKEHDMFAKDNDEKVSHLMEMEKMCEVYDTAQLAALVERLSVKDGSAREVLNGTMDNQRKAEAESTVKSEGSLSSSKGGVEWGTEELQTLIKAVKLFPAGTNQRWDVVTEFINQHNGGVAVRGVKETISKAKELQGSNFATSSLLDDVNKMAYENMQKGVKKEVLERCAEESKGTERTDNVAEQAGLNPTPWTPDEQKLLEQALKTYDSKTPERWERISEAVPGRSKKDCMKRYKELAEIVKAKKAAALAAAKKS